ncbi:MAG: hypothetical protein K2M65_02420 [Muribaculaceae bacterium]|nr:hypothetical protein [Muribaculaceae bacterium]
MVWLFSGHTHQSVVDAVTPGKSNVVSTDSLRLPDSTAVVNKTKSSRTRKKAPRQPKPMEPRWSPLDEPVPQTK